MKKRSKPQLIGGLAVVLMLIALGVTGSYAQREITDQVPHGEPRQEPLGQGMYKLTYKNKAGDVIREVTQQGLGQNAVHKTTKYITKVHANGKPAEETILTGDKLNSDDPDSLIKLETKQVRTLDREGGEIESTTYKKFTHGYNGSETEKVVFKAGRSQTYVKVRGEWKPKEGVADEAPVAQAKPVPKPKPKPPAIILAVDECVVGKWTAMPSTNQGSIGEGLIYFTGGLVLTIEPDGHTVFDFEKMPAYIRPNGDAIEENRASGSRSAMIKTYRSPNLGTMMETKTAPKSSVVVRMTTNKGLYLEDKPTVFFPMSTAYVGGTAGEVTDYTCKGDTLTIARGGLTFKRTE